jgi:hypothetical protein
MPLPSPFAWANEKSNVSVVKSMTDVVELTGMPCSEEETFPVPQATE